MAGIPLIPGATVTSGTYTVYDSNSSSGNKNKTPVELISSGNTWTGVNSFSAKPTYKFLQSMNVTRSLALNHGVNLEDSDIEIKFALSGNTFTTGRHIIKNSIGESTNTPGGWVIITTDRKSVV